MNLTFDIAMTSTITNLTSGAAKFRKSYMVFYMISLPISLIGIISNIILIVTVIKRKQFQTPSYILSANMAVSDVIVLVFGSIFLISNVVLSLNTEVEHLSRRIICQFNFMTMYFSFCTSSQSFMAISIDRYRIITSINSKSPFHNKKILKITIGMTWLIGLAFAIPMLYISNINPRLPLMCDFQPYGAYQNRLLSLYHVAALFITFIIPLITVLIMYYKIIRHISKSIANSRFNLGKNYDHSKQRQIRATKLMILATLLFMLNSLPIMVSWTVCMLTGKSYTELVLTYGQFIFILISSAFFIASLTAIQNPFAIITCETG